MEVSSSLTPTFPRQWMDELLKIWNDATWTFEDSVPGAIVAHHVVPRYFTLAVWLSFRPRFGPRFVLSISRMICVSDVGNNGSSARKTALSGVPQILVFPCWTGSTSTIAHLEH